jgi:hypothetical protein
MDSSGMEILADERNLIELWILPDEQGPHEARVRGHGVSVWALIGYWRAVNFDAEATSQAYQIPREAMEAVLALYRRYEQYVDARLLLNETAAEDWSTLVR